MDVFRRVMKHAYSLIPGVDLSRSLNISHLHDVRIFRERDNYLEQTR